MGSSARELIRQWWRQDDQYGWASSYLASRNLRKFTQMMVALIIASFGLVPVSIALGPEGARGQLGEPAGFAVSGCCLVLAACWVLRWPTRGQSAAFALVSTMCIAVACFIDQDRQTGLMGCVTFAMISGYVALFHTARFMLVVVFSAAITTCVLGTNLIHDRPDLALPAGRMVLGALTMLAFPLVVQALILYLLDDAHRSDVDPLSGLLNRRGFDRAIAELMATRPRAENRYLVLAMIDLDDFKRVNDTRGHAVGDRALIAVGESLTHHSRDTAVIARAGGEEFFVVDVYSTPDVTVGERLRDAISRTPFGVTASVGIATRLLPWPHCGTPVVEEMINAADTAMYEAKRAGGNQTRMRHLHDLPNA